MRCGKILWVCLMVLHGLPQANAADYSLALNVSAAYDEAFMPIPVPDLTTRTDPVVLQVDLDIYVSNLAANELGFGAISFRYDLEGGVADTYSLGFNRNNYTIDVNGALPGGIVELFPPSLIDDPIGSPNSVILGIASGVSDPNDLRAKVGQPGGISLLGSWFLLYDPPSGPGRLALSPVYIAANSTSGSLLPFVLQPGVEIRLGAVPEPATVWFALVGLGWVIRPARRNSPH